MKLLIVEDNLDLSRALKVIFERNHYEVDVTDNGIDAVGYALSNHYDALILDIMIPGRDGLSVIKELRDRGLVIPTIMLTAKTQLFDKVAGLDAGADDYLTKPFEAVELLARVRAMLRRKQMFKNDFVSLGELVLDHHTYELKYKDRIERLTKKTFLTMEMLMEMAEKIVSTPHLIEHIWGWDTDVDTNVIWVYISNLRQTLTKLNAPYEIKVVRGVGYILGAIK